MFEIVREPYEAFLWITDINMVVNDNNGGQKSQRFSSPSQGRR
jgi:hypothetical protein